MAMFAQDMLHIVSLLPALVGTEVHSIMALEHTFTTISRYEEWLRDIVPLCNYHNLSVSSCLGHYKGVRFLWIFKDGKQIQQ